MSQKHGTPSNWTLGQFTRIAATILTALPKALSKFSPKHLIPRAEKKGEFIERELEKIFLSLLGPASDSRGLAFKSLELIAGGIEIATESFAKDSFWKKNGPVKLWFSADFIKQVLKGLPDSIPAFSGTLTKAKLMKSMYDSEILVELGNPRAYSLAEIGAILPAMLLKQAHGEAGDLETNGYANTFYVLNDGRVVAVNVFWLADGREWSLGALDLVDDRWLDGLLVFSRS